MADSEMAKGFKCECGTEHEFPAYVYAHWNESLIHTCPNCERRHSVKAGKVKLLRRRRNEVEV